MKVILSKFYNQFKHHEVIVLFILFVILTLPRSINDLLPIVTLAINGLEVFSSLIVLLLCIYKRPKISSVSRILILFFSFLALSTALNLTNPIVFLKTYILNIAIIILAELILNSKYLKTILHYCCSYLLILLIANFIQIVIYKIIGYRTETDYILGLDNRFILYVLPTLAGYCYLRLNEPTDKTITITLILTYIIGTLSMLLTWSAAALAVMIIIIFGVIITFKVPRIHLNAKVITVAILLISAALVLFRFQYILKPIIVDILHKSLTLSYRTYIWDVALSLLWAHPLNLLFGFGYFDYTSILSSLPNSAMRVNHFHNILVNTCFAGGLIGLTILLYAFIKVATNIDKIKDKLTKNTYIMIFIGLMALLTVDTFEGYRIYYFLIILLSGLAQYESSLSIEYLKRTSKNKLKKTQSSKVGIILATYNGEKFITEQLESIANQSYTNWELYISDDNSSDNTSKIVEKFSKQHPRKVHFFYNQSNKHGLLSNFNSAFQKAEKCEYYMFCDQDDVWHKDKILYMLAKIQQEEKASEESEPMLVYCDAFVTNNSLTPFESSLVNSSNRVLPNNKNYIDLLLVQCYFPGCTLMFNAALKKTIKKIFSKAEAHDWWAGLVAATNGKISYLDIPLHYYRQHSSNTFGAHVGKTKIAAMAKKVNKNNAKTWRDYQKTVLLQAKELYKLYPNSQYAKSIKRFIRIMEEKSQVKRLIMLIFSPYYPIQKIRILRLVL